MRLLKSYADHILTRTVPAWRAKRKYEAEIAYWRGELDHLKRWFVDGSIDWWGIRAPTDKLAVSTLWSVNAVMTMHTLRPSYWEELRLSGDHFQGQRLLEVGCGPLVPCLQFSGCERHGIDPLISTYLEVGWPLFAYDAKLINSGAESMPYPDGYFDSVISVNALDHVDDFERVAAEIQRVVKPGGEICFEVEYHLPTVTEPITLSDRRVLAAFQSCEMTKIIDRGGHDMFQALVDRFDLLANQFARFGEERFVTWRGKRRA